MLNANNNTVMGTFRDTGATSNFPSFALGASTGGKDITVPNDGSRMVDCDAGIAGDGWPRALLVT